MILRCFNLVILWDWKKRFRCFDSFFPTFEINNDIAIKRDILQFSKQQQQVQKYVEFVTKLYSHFCRNEYILIQLEGPLNVITI